MYSTTTTNGDPITTLAMSDLPAGAVFIGPTGDKYKVVTAACEHPRGWVAVWNLSMPEDEVQRRFAAPGAVEAGCHPREGTFAYTYPTMVQVLEPVAR